jgi:predicted NACHT family NTPase
VTDITTIPTHELHDDRAESISDIEICELALENGVTHWGNAQSTQYRLDVNRRIVARIDKEIERRALAARVEELEKALRDLRESTITALLDLQTLAGDEDPSTKGIIMADAELLEKSLENALQALAGADDAR